MSFQDPHTRRQRPKPQPYLLADDTRVPSVTQVLDMIDKPGLVHWAYRLGTQGKDYTVERDDTADAGTYAHILIVAYLDKRPPERPEGLPQHVIDWGQNAFGNYLLWARDHTVIPLATELRMASPDMGYGGTADLVANVDGRLEVMDFKTGRHYKTHILQLAAYAALVSEQTEWTPESVRALYVPREGDVVQDHITRNWMQQHRAFMELLRARQALVAAGAL